MTPIFDWRTNYTGNLSWLPDRTILLVRSGSHAYGLNTPESDVDVKGVAIPPSAYFTGFLNRFEQAEVRSPIDLTIYDIRKFMKLCADCNPNIIEMLWADEEDYFRIRPENRVFLSMLRDARADFLSTKAQHTFSGYAHAQLKRIRGHRAWLLDPPTAKPLRADFGLPETTVLDGSLRGAITALMDSPEADEMAIEGMFGSTIMRAYAQERAYHNKLTYWTQYENWKKHRNPKRAAMEAESGYDRKHGMHLIRLYLMGIEILQTGKVKVRRTEDREELLGIRNGALPYEQLEAYATKLETQLRTAVATSPLPHSPDRVHLDKLCQSMVELMNFAGMS